MDSVRRVPIAVNEPVKSYAPGTPERADLKARITTMAAERIDIPLVIGGKHIRSGDTRQIVMPFAHRHVLADAHAAGRDHVQHAIATAVAAGREWSQWSLSDRAAVFLKAADLL